MKVMLVLPFKSTVKIKWNSTCKVLWLCLPIEKKWINISRNHYSFSFFNTKIFYSVHPQINPFSHSLYIVGHSSLPLLEMSFKPATSCQTSTIPPGVQVSAIIFAPFTFHVKFALFLYSMCWCTGSWASLLPSLHLGFLLPLPERLALSFRSCLRRSI